MNQTQNMNNSGTKELYTKENTVLISMIHLSFPNIHHHQMQRLNLLLHLSCISSEFKGSTGPRLKVCYFQSTQNNLRKISTKASMKSHFF